jgi:uncharacterized membrane protein YccC
MNTAKLSAEAEKAIQQESLRPEFSRALRGTAAFVGPLLLFQVIGATADVYFAAIGAQIVALTDVRGAYRFRLAILLAVAAVITGATLLGALASQQAVVAVLGMGGLALLSGLWRHLSWDYGPGLGVSSALLFIVALALPPGHGPILHHAGFTLLGACWGIGLHALLWPFRPQHALRQATAESWLAVSELFAAMRPDATHPDQDRTKLTAARELELRTALDRTAATLAAATTRRTAPLVAHLTELHLTAARLGTRAVALNASLEGLLARPDFARIAPTVDSVLHAFTNLTRSVALTTITHRPENFAISEVRLRRCANLVSVLAGHLDSLRPDVEIATAKELLRQIGVHLIATEKALRETVDRGAAPVGFPLRLPDLSVLSPRALSSWINPAPHLDPVLVRHTLRMVVLTMAAIALYKVLGVPRGYWIAFTVIVVLQPDYGATRKRAGQRILGTLAGSLVASGLLWIRMPLPLLDVLIAASVFGFAYNQKQRYGLAVFFITLMLVFLTETTAPVTMEFTVTRLLCSLAGGGLALIGALLFWPSWERQRFPFAMATAIRANQVYLEAVTGCIFAGTAFVSSAVQTKRAAENANSNASASLQRMLGEPANRRSNAELAAALAHGNVRMTRAITILAVQIQAGAPVAAPALVQTVRQTAEALDALAQAVESEETTPAEVARRIQALDQLETPPDNERQLLVRTQLGKIATEMSAMLLAITQTGTAADARAPLTTPAL